MVDSDMIIDESCCQTASVLRYSTVIPSGSVFVVMKDGDDM